MRFCCWGPVPRGCRILRVLLTMRPAMGASVMRLLCSIYEIVVGWEVQRFIEGFARGHYTWPAA